MKYKLINKYIILFATLTITITIALAIILNSNKKLTKLSTKTNAKANDTILILALNFNESKLLNQIKNKVQEFYKTPTIIKSSNLPANAYYKTRNRYKADSIINFLEKYNNKRYRFIAGLTSKDISTTLGKHSDWGIFGLGSLNNKGCITSSFRLKKNVTEEKLLERLQKVTLHEIGHNYGLNHCTTSNPCLMKAANGKVSTVDKEPMNFCKSCKTKIDLK